MMENDKLHKVTADQVMKALQRLGFKKISQKGSHQKWFNEKTGRLTILAYHRKKIIHPKTLKTIIEGTGLSIKEFNSYL